MAMLFKKNAMIVVLLCVMTITTFTSAADETAKAGMTMTLTLDYFKDYKMEIMDAF